MTLEGLHYMTETIIPQITESIQRVVIENMPTGDYRVEEQPEKLHQPFRQISGQPILPSRAIHPIYPDKEVER